MINNWARIRSRQLRQAISATYERHQAFVPALAFVAGIAVDLITVGRIDQWSNILMLGAYLCIAGSLLALEIITSQGTLSPKQNPWLLLWTHHIELSHFCLGNLLSALAILFFKSASLWSAFIFLLVIVVTLVANQFSRVRRAGIALRTALFALVLASYLACLIPVFWGEVGAIPFVLALMTAIGIFGALLFGVSFWISTPRVLVKPVLLPFISVVGSISAFYFLGIIPPVPLALRDIGIYYNVTRLSNDYALTRIKQPWHFWFWHQDTFSYRPGDRMYCFFSVFSPVGFRDQLQVRWLYHDSSKGWQAVDALWVPITGGRLEGYRGFAYKSHLQPGKWRVLIETTDAREIGRLDINVVLDTSHHAREFITEKH